jgi:hypothetical protein
MKQRDLLLILAAASVAITAIALMFGVLFMFLFFPLVLPFAFRRRFQARKEQTFRRPPPYEGPYEREEDEDWRKKWK